MINPWKVLGVHQQATAEEARAAYLERVAKVHPDKGGSSADCARLNEAYSYFKDRKKMSIFIKDLIIRNEECRSCKGKGARFKSRGILGRSATPCDVCGGAGLIIGGDDHGRTIVTGYNAPRGGRNGRPTKAAR